MRILRSPEERFENLPGYSFSPHYIEIADGGGGKLRVHYVDEGPREAAPVLLMHGEPSWSYLYRKMIPLITEAGNRVISPDLVGFGRSDKPADRNDYTYQRHVDWIQQVVAKLTLNRITLVCQDWGGLIGLVVAAALIGLTGLWSPIRFHWRLKMSDAFLEWQRFSGKRNFVSTPSVAAITNRFPGNYFGL
jgi:haloalkane dehalogenase